MKLWLYLHFAHLQLDSLDNTELAQPRAVICPKHHQILQFNEMARCAGLNSGMGLGMASSLCPDLETIIYDAAYEQQLLECIAQTLYQVTADISLWSPNGLLLLVSPMRRLYRDLSHYWRRITTAIGTQYNYHYACGFTPLAARLLARAKQNLLTGDPHFIEARLRERPIVDLEWHPGEQHQLASVGIHQLGKLLDLSRGELNRRFDADCLHFLYRLQGITPHPVRWYHPPEYFDAQQELLHDTEQTQHLLHPIQSLLEQLAQYWCQGDKTSQRIQLVLLTRQTSPLTLAIRAGEASRDPAFWLQLIKLRLETTELSAPVHSVRLVCTDLTPFQGKSNALFSTHLSQGNASLLLSLLESRLGSHCISVPGLKDDPRPEVRNYRRSPWHQCEFPRCRPQLRPAQLLPAPQPLTTWVSIQQGPERIDTGWWDGAPVKRDYFIAHDKSLRWLWVFRTEANRWFVHGLFS